MYRNEILLWGIVSIPWLSAKSISEHIILYATHKISTAYLEKCHLSDNSYLNPVTHDIYLYLFHLCTLSEIVTAPSVDPKHEISNLPSSLPINTPATIATTTPASSSITSLEDSSPRHYQHASSQERQQPLVNQVSSYLFVTFFRVVAARAI